MVFVSARVCAADRKWSQQLPVSHALRSSTCQSRHERMASRPGELMSRDLPSITSHYATAPRDSGTRREDMSRL